MFGLFFSGSKINNCKDVQLSKLENYRKYHLTILSPKELTGKKVSVSAKFMERGKWTKTDTSKHNK